MGDDSSASDEEGFYRVQFVDSPSPMAIVTHDPAHFINEPRYSDCLFLFPDDYANFRTSGNQDDRHDMHRFNRHGDHKMRPRSCGIVLRPTAQTDFLYQNIAEVCEIIDESLQQIYETVAMMKYRYLIFFGFYPREGEIQVDLPLDEGIVFYVRDYINTRLTAMMHYYIEE